MKKTFKIVGSLFLVVFITWIIYLNGKLYHQPKFVAHGKTEINEDVLGQLRFLRTEIRDGGADDMQQYYPEGFVFMNVLYGLSWCEIAGAAGHQSALYKEAHDEIQFSYAQINSEKGKTVFDKDLPIPYGAFYTGWNNYLLGKKLSIEDRQIRDPVEINLYNSQCAQIVSALQKSETPFPESYAHACWPADAVVAVASLTLRPKTDSPIYTGEIHKWVDRVKSNLDPNGLIPHSAQYFSGKPQEHARGSSQSLILNFLIEIDSAFAREQFKIYKDKFLTLRFGLPGLCEFPMGEDGFGDIDSGPVIFGIGGAATIVGLRTMTIFGEQKTAIALHNGIEAFGFASSFEGKKKFLFGKLSMADAFIAWANSKEITKDKMLSTDEHWRWKFQLYSLLMSTLLLLFLIKAWRVKAKLSSR
ncbi:MAG TPA: hypothetical protein VE978_13070 [Chitinophagales bacterium]|nr:hypothetical protein [Chitinophagales bacterium]